MAECDVCGERESMPYHCRHCGGTHCSQHRLPESHDCPAVDQWEEQGAVFDSGFEGTIGASDDGDGGLAARLGLDTGLGRRLEDVNMTYVFLGLMWATFISQFIVAWIIDPGEAVTDTWENSDLWRAIFVFSSDNPLYVWTWFTSIFAHGGIVHIVVNSIVIYFFGQLVERYVGWKSFAYLFIASGVIAGFGQIGFQIIVGDAGGVVGASGAALALLGLLTILNPNLTVYLFFLVPLPIWTITGGMTAISVLFILTGEPDYGGIAHVAHLVGLLIGLAYGHHVKDQVRVPNQLRFGGGPGGPGGRGPGGPGGPGGRGPF